MIGLDSYSRQVFIYLDAILIYISLWIDCLFEIRKIAMFPLAFVAGWLQGHWWGFISRNYVVWPIFFLMNVFIAFKGSHFWYLLTPWWWYFFYLTLYVFSSVFIYYPCRCSHNRSPSKIPPLCLPLGRLEGYMNSETRRRSWKIKVSIATRLQYDIINGDKHTRAWIHKNPRFLGEFQDASK